MKKIIFSLIILLLFVTPVSAHGGFEKNANNTIVSITQLPISPLIGEKVDFTFKFRDPTVVVNKDLSVQNLASIPVQVKIIDTFYGDESKDKVIYEKEYKTDTNGNISFSYTFPKENYFDIELSYPDHSGIPQETGFLVQPREAKKDNILIYYLIPVLITGILLGFLAGIKFK